jgi:hypothetical protein
MGQVIALQIKVGAPVIGHHVPQHRHCIVGALHRAILLRRQLLVVVTGVVARIKGRVATEIA